MIEVVKVKYFAEVITGGTPSTKKTEYWDGGQIPWLNSGELNQKIISTTRNYITDEGLKNSAAKLMPEDSVLMALTGSTTGVVGYLTFEASANQSVTGILPSEKHFPKYLYFYLNSIREKVLHDAYGGAQPHISQKYVKELKIPLPPLEEQKRIAAILDAADEVRQKNKALIAKYDELTQSLFLDMFGDPVTNPKGWEEWKLGLVTSMKAGKFVAASDINDEQSEGMFQCFGGNGLRGFVESFTHEGDYVLIGRQGALCGNVKIASGKFHATEHAIVCSPKEEYQTIWLYHLLKIANLNRFATGAAQPGLNVGKLVELEFMFPPIELQNQFAESVQAIESQKAQAQASLEKAEELFASLLQRAFKGELLK